MFFFTGFSFLTVSFFSTGAFAIFKPASASVAGYNTPMEIIFEFGEEMMPVPLAYLEYPFLWLNNKIIFGENANLSAVDSINSCDTPVMLIHGKTDEIKELEAKLNSLLAEQGRLNTRLKELQGISI